MHNTVTIAEIKRRGMATIEEGLRWGPVHIIKRNKSAAVVLSEEEYLRLTGEQVPAVQRTTAMQWLLTQPAGIREKAEIDTSLAEERDW
ncbi:hypothetical protein [Halopseudomonas pelagia]|uniref:hypothetical protein n=1 Tax=Halopseudomonas pelagia TaxID=553151 RepID=UPI0030DBCAFA|tara:strand:- start:28614 stop:28880 length:267 start_codon:yes stop_codon:yes gene_type:complete